MSVSPRTEVIVKVLAEGGSVTLHGASTPNGWVFYRDVRDQTPDLLDEPWIEHSSMQVATWPAALELLDRYPWYRLYPKVVHPDFRGAVLEAVEERYREAGPVSHSRLPMWRELCGAV